MTSTTTPRAARASLRSQVTYLVALVIAALAVAHGAVSLWLYVGALQEQLRLKGDAFAAALAGDAQLKVGVWAGYQKGIEDQLADALKRQQALSFAAVVEDRRVLGYAGRDPVVAAANKVRLARGLDIEDVLVRRATIEEQQQQPVAAGGADDLGLLEPGAGAGAPVARKDDAKRAVVVVGVERGSISSSTARHALLTFVLGLFAVIIATALVGRVFAGMFRRVRRVSDVAGVLASGDLREPIGDEGGDEIGAVARSVDEIRVKWTSIVKDIRAVSDEVARSTREITDHSARVAEGSGAQVDAAAATARRSAAILADAQGLKQIVDGMVRITRESSESLSKGREASRSVTAEMDRMLKSLHENDGHRDDLSNNVTAIASALAQLSGAVKSALVPADDVARRMSDAAETSNAIALHARVVVERSGAALALLDKQRTSSDAVARGATETADATVALQDAMADVLSTTALIRDIADLTSMLSLNASIIAAQAGDRALGFGTVADEIRSLATRTRSAVDGIERRAAAARKQLAAMSEVVGGLSSTVQTSRTSTEETTSVLQQVLEQMNGALAQVAGLATLITESSRGTRTSRDAVGLIDQEVKNIAIALENQRSSQLRLEESAQAMGKNVGGVRETGRQQAVTTGALIDSMTQLARSTEDLVSLCAAQAESAEAIAGETARVKHVAENHRSTVESITQAVARLDGEARALREAIETLQVG